MVRHISSLELDAEAPFLLARLLRICLTKGWPVPDFERLRHLEGKDLWDAVRKESRGLIIVSDDGDLPMSKKEYRQLR